MAYEGDIELLSDKSLKSLLHNQTQITGLDSYKTSTSIKNLSSGQKQKQATACRQPLSSGAHLVTTESA